MNSFFVVIPAGLVALLLWLRGRPAKPMLASTDVNDVVALNRQQLSLVISAENDSVPIASQAWVPPTNQRERLALMQSLRQAMTSGPQDRLEAVQQAQQWGASCVVPILRQALRDSDARVVEAAAAAMQRFRGAAKAPVAQAARPPRNVARMR